MNGSGIGTVAVLLLGGLAYGRAALVEGQEREPVSPDPDLAAEVARLDSALFAAFNDHDLVALMSYFSRDLEFYHDQDGLISYDEVRRGFRSLFEADNGLRRDLVPGSSSVYPVPGFGAIQTGAHRFCHLENGRQDCGTFEFTHVWRRDGGRWRIARALSYGH